MLLLIPCCKASESIRSILDAIPNDIWHGRAYRVQVLVIDDGSQDETYPLARDYMRRHPERDVAVLHNPRSQGHGGNQKIGFSYAIHKGFDIVVLLSGCDRGPIWSLGRLIKPILDGQADAVLGSRLLRRQGTGERKLPLPRRLAKRLLASIQNRIIGSTLSDFSAAHRAYRAAALASIPYEYNSNGYDFDTDIILQLLDTDRRLVEIPVDVFDGDGLSAVDEMRQAIRSVRSCLRSKANKLGVYYHPRFDYEPTSNTRYQGKFGYPSSHQFALDAVRPGSTVVDVGCGPGFMATHLAKSQSKTVSIDLQVQPETRRSSWKCIETDVEQYDFGDDFGHVNYILLLDILEHLKSPERLLQRLRHRFGRRPPAVIITTGNVAFLPLRLSLLFASFNYGRRGVLDMDHTRLFTFSSLRKTLEMNGYEIVRTHGVPVPFPLALGIRRLAEVLLWVNQVLITFWKGLFSYQIAVIAKPLPTVKHLLEDACGAKAGFVRTVDPAESVKSDLSM